MKNKNPDDIEKMWNQDSDEYYSRIYTLQNNIARLKAEPTWAFPTLVYSMLRDALTDFNGKRVLVPSSGDNGAVFAFHLLGASVTSADISERQLENAKRIADMQGWDIEFVHTDSMKLDGIGDGAYDLVYTSNGVHTWIDDLNAMYRSFYRVLKREGRYIMFETHPFIRPFDDSTHELRLIKDYNDNANCDWRIMNLVNAMLEQGFRLEQMEEFHAQPGSHDLWWYKTLADAEADCNREFDRTYNPWAALPQWIGFSIVKEGAKLCT